MTIEVKARDEKIILEMLRSGAFDSVEELIHRALISLSLPESSPSGPAIHLADLLGESPFAGSELDFERRKTYPRQIVL